MATIQDIRRANLFFLVQEVEHELGTERGAQAELARKTGVSAPFISQFLRRERHQGGGERKMGDTQARKLEKGMDKPEGWIDVDRTAAKNWKEAQILDLLRPLSEDQREAVVQVIRQFSSRE